MSRSFNEELQTDGALYERLEFASHSRTADGRGRTELCDFSRDVFLPLWTRCWLLSTNSWIYYFQQFSTRDSQYLCCNVTLQPGLLIELLFSQLKNVRVQFDWLSELEILDLLKRQSSFHIYKERSCDQLWITVTLILPLATAMHKRNCFFHEVPASADVIERIVRPS